MSRTCCFALAAGLCCVFNMQHTAAQSPLPAGRLTTPRESYENDIGQIGGKGVGYYQSLQNLRCQNSGDALVGVEIGRGTVIYHLRIACAPVTCSDNGCSWSAYSWGTTVGNPSGGQTRPAMICKQNEMISGMRGRAIGLGVDYAADVEFECAAITGKPVPQNPRLITTSLTGRNWRYWGGNLVGTLSKPLSCPTFGSTGVAVAVGLYPTGANVIQAVSLMCGTANLCPSGQTYMSELNTLYATSSGQCTGCCKTCVDLAGSTNPTTMATDRLVAPIPNITKYNCHFYTLTYMKQVKPNASLRRPRIYETFGPFEISGECITDSDLTGAGYSKVQAGAVNPANLQLGDIVTVYPTAVITASTCRNSHSGVVIQAGRSQPGYNNVVIRQKPDPFHCPVDLTWQEFVAVYGLADRRKYGANAWR